jgi:hypothetical protein
MTDKQSGILVYLQEELTDARLRCEQLKQFVSQAVRIVGQSAEKDHFYEVAGDILYGLPEALFKLDKALDATALAASRLDYEELRSQLKPEKVTELETALRNVRLRQIDRRAPLNQNTPEGFKMARGLEIQDVKELQVYMEDILAEIYRAKKWLPPTLWRHFITIQDRANKALKTLGTRGLTTSSLPKKQGSKPMYRAASTNHIASALRRIASEIESARISPKEATLRLNRVKMALSQTAQEAVEAMGDIQATSREDVIKGFKSANPALTDDQLEEIADQWDRNKNVVKDKSQ